MVKHCSTHKSVTLETAWHAVMMVLALQSRRKGSASFWIQVANRQAENMDVFGYVTSEVGLVIEVDVEESFEQRLSQCLHALTSIDADYRNVFPEIASGHPLFEAFLRCSLGVNLVGNAMDTTDRSVIRRALGRDDDMIWGPMNWMEIGNESNQQIAFYGRPDIVEFCCDTLLPALLELQLGEMWTSTM